MTTPESDTSASGQDVTLQETKPVETMISIHPQPSLTVEERFTLLFFVDGFATYTVPKRRVAHQLFILGKHSMLAKGESIFLSLP